MNFAKFQEQEELKKAERRAKHAAKQLLKPPTSDKKKPRTPLDIDKQKAIMREYKKKYSYDHYRDHEFCIYYSRIKTFLPYNTPLNHPFKKQFAVLNEFKSRCSPLDA